VEGCHGQSLAVECRLGVQNSMCSSELPLEDCSLRYYVSVLKVLFIKVSCSFWNACEQ
jgi:hypothetical protein